jgi:hypothetical protein
MSFAAGAAWRYIVASGDDKRDHRSYASRLLIADQRRATASAVTLPRRRDTRQ